MILLVPSSCNHCCQISKLFFIYNTLKSIFSIQTVIKYESNKSLFFIVLKKTTTGIFIAPLSTFTLHPPTHCPYPCRVVAVSPTPQILREIYFVAIPLDALLRLTPRIYIQVLASPRNYYIRVTSSPSNTDECVTVLLLNRIHRECSVVHRIFHFADQFPVERQSGQTSNGFIAPAHLVKLSGPLESSTSAAAVVVVHKDTVHNWRNLNKSRKAAKV